MRTIFPCLPFEASQQNVKHEPFYQSGKNIFFCFHCQSNVNQLYQYLSIKHSFPFLPHILVQKVRKYQMADMEKLSAWIKCMSKEEYRLFHTNCLDCISDIETIQLFRSNENNLYSWGELKSDINVYYMAQTTQPIFVGQEYIVEPMCEEYDEDDYSNLFGKIKANLAELRETSMGRDAVCQTLCMIAENESDYEDERSFLHSYMIHLWVYHPCQDII